MSITVTQDLVAEMYDRWSAAFTVEPDMALLEQHTFQMAARRSPLADDAIRRLADWARPHLGL